MYIYRLYIIYFIISIGIIIIIYYIIIIILYFYFYYDYYYYVLYYYIYIHIYVIKSDCLGLNPLICGILSRVQYPTNGWKEGGGWMDG